MATTLSIGVSRLISERKAWIAHENIAVVLVLDNTGEEDSPIVIMLRAIGELNEVLVLFLNTHVTLLCASHFLFIVATLDFDIGTNKLIN